MDSVSQTYNEIEISSEVLAASSHRIIQMLMEKCLQHINLAKSGIANNQLQVKRQAIGKATAIVSYLRDCLRFEEPKMRELAELLDSLYEFITRSFLQATLKNDSTFLDHAQKVLSSIKEGWDGIAPSNQ